MVVLEQLRYVRLVADDLGRAADFAQRVLGLEPIDRSQELRPFDRIFATTRLLSHRATTPCSPSVWKCVTQTTSTRL